MASATDFPAKGKVIEVRDGVVVFQPTGTTYELHLETTAPYTGPKNQQIEAYIKVKARKVYTVPSGGNFITPIQGQTRIIQGRVRYVDNTTLVIHAAVPVIVDLPVDDRQIELSEGQITVGRIANVVVFPGATMALVQPAVA